MDETDIALSLMLLQNSRIPYRALAEKLNLSVSAIHARIQAMVEAGVIRGFTALPSLRVTSSLLTYTYGQTRAENLNELTSKLSANDSIFWVAQAGGGYLYIGSYVRNLGGLSALSEFLAKTADMPDPKVGIIAEFSSNPIPPRQSLDSLDWRIIQELSNDSRRPLAEIAEALNASAKTVRRRLNTMVEKSLIDLSIRWYPDASDDIISVLHTRHASGKSLDLKNVYRMLSPHILFPVSFINLPNENLFFIWTRNMKELKELRQRVEADTTFSLVQMNILYTGEIFPTWRDTLPAMMGRQQ